MKRHELINYLLSQGCLLYREGSRHSLFFNPTNKQFSTVPRHNEIKNLLAAKICKDLGIAHKS